MARLVKNCLQCRRPGFNSCVGKIHWGTDRLCTPVFWPGEFHGLYSRWGCKVGHDWATFTFTSISFSRGSNWGHTWQVTCGAILKGDLKPVWALGDFKKLFICVLVTPCSMWNLSSLTRDRTCAPILRKAESQPLDLQGRPLGDFRDLFLCEVQNLLENLIKALSN